MLAISGGVFFLFGAGSFLYLGHRISAAVEVLRDREREVPVDFDYTLTLILGAIIGMTIGITLVVSSIVTASGILYRRPDRTADLLLECWDQLAAKREAATSYDPDFS
ncbi:hypothetical protein [Caulifigura coniformis]|nr:hypothetical protein [Caulifigura coniformis]